LVVQVPADHIQDHLLGAADGSLVVSQDRARGVLRRFQQRVMRNHLGYQVDLQCPLRIDGLCGKRHGQAVKTRSERSFETRIEGYHLALGAGQAFVRPPYSISMTCRAKDGLSSIMNSKRFSSIVTSLQSVLAMAVALRGALSIVAISPMIAPAEAVSKVRPPRWSSISPAGTMYIRSLGSPCAKLCVPAL